MDARFPLEVAPDPAEMIPAEIFPTEGLEEGVALNYKLMQLRTSRTITWPVKADIFDTSIYVLIKKLYKEKI